MLKPVLVLVFQLLSVRALNKMFPASITYMQ